MKWRRRVVLLAVVGTLILGVAGSGVLAQPENVVSASVLSLLVPQIWLEYERAISRAMSFYVGPILGFPVYVAARVGIKIYPGGTAPEGFWIGGFGGFRTGTAGDLAAGADGHILSLLRTSSGHVHPSGIRGPA